MRTWNFYAGPATLPPPALERAKAEIPDWENTGMSVMETSHRSPEYDVVHHGAMNLMAELLGLDDDRLAAGARERLGRFPLDRCRDRGFGLVSTGVAHLDPIRDSPAVIRWLRPRAFLEAAKFSRGAAVRPIFSQI